jgi:hypothetical protein
MIVFDLLCGEGHRFEGWFGSAADFAAQKERRQLACPGCGNAQVERVPSVSRVNLGAPEPRPPGKGRPSQEPAGRPSQEPAGTPSHGPGAPQRAPEMEGKDPFAIAQMLYSRMLDELLTKTQDVGKDFPAEARRIFYEEAPARAIRGVVSAEEHDELLDEGIPVARLPLPPGRLN